MSSHIRAHVSTTVHTDQALFWEGNGVSSHWRLPIKDKDLPVIISEIKVHNADIGHTKIHIWKNSFQGPTEIWSTFGEG